MRSDRSRTPRTVLLWLAFCSVYGAAGHAAASPSSALADAAAVSKQVRRALDGGKFAEAATLTFTSVEKLRDEASSQTTGEDDRATLLRAACVALRTLTRLDEQKAAFAAEIATRDRLQADCTPKSPAEPSPAEPKPDAPANPQPDAAVVPDPKVTPPAEPQPAPAVPPPPPAPSKASPGKTPLRTAAITTGVLGGVALVSSAIMASVVARPGGEPDCSNCLAGSYSKAFAAAKASWNDADPSNDVAHGAGDHVCSDSSRSANPDVAEACDQRDQLRVGMFVSLGVGAVLGTAAVVTGVLHARKARSSGYTFTVRPVVGRQWMLSATLRF